MLISGDTSFHNQVREPLMVCPSKEHNNGIKKNLQDTEPIESIIKKL